MVLQDNPDTLQHCSEPVVAHLVNFVSNFAGELSKQRSLIKCNVTNIRV